MRINYPRPSRKEEIPSLYPSKKEGIKIYERDIKVMVLTVFFYSALILISSL